MVPGGFCPVIGLGVSYQVKGSLSAFADERLGNGWDTGRGGHFWRRMIEANKEDKPTAPNIKGKETKSGHRIAEKVEKPTGFVEPRLSD